MNTKSAPAEAGWYAAMAMALTTAAIVFALSSFLQTAWAQGGERSGKAVTETVCVACHGKGVDGAPKIGDRKAWAMRAALGLTGLSRQAVEGMCRALGAGREHTVSPIEIERAITYMVNQSGGHWTEPISRTARAADHSGALVVQTHCAKCHEKGVGGAPMIGDRLAWVPRATQGFDTLIRSAINGHGGMPPRGGAADLTDNQISSAVAYMLNPLSAVATAPLAEAAKPDRNHRTVDGMDIYFGAISADSLRRQHAGGDAETSQSAGIPAGKSYYHLNISLFDAQTKAPIANAYVEAKIADPVMGDQVKALRPMAANNMLSYGNFFRIPEMGGDQSVAVLVRKAGDWHATEARFGLSP